MTLLLSRSDLAGPLDLDECMRAIRAGFAAAGSPTAELGVNDLSPQRAAAFGGRAAATPEAVAAQRLATASGTALAEVIGGDAPWQDLALSWVAYQAAQGVKGAGLSYDWLS